MCSTRRGAAAEAAAAAAAAEEEEEEPAAAAVGAGAAAAGVAVEAAAEAAALSSAAAGARLPSSPPATVATPTTSASPPVGPTGGGTEVVVKGFFFGRELSVLRVSVGGNGAGCTTDEIAAQTSGCAEAKIVASTFKNGATIKDFDYMIVIVPPGQGKDQDFIVWRGKQPSPAAKLSYHRPAITKIIATDQTGKTTDVAPLCPTTGGVKLSIAGTNFGLSGKV